MPHNKSQNSLDIKNVFSRIVPTYDLLNHLLSLGMDIHWRKKLARRINSGNMWGVDLCGGTGDMALSASGKSRNWIVTDFSYNMLLRAKQKFHKRNINGFFVCADIFSLPFKSGIINTVVITFGIRNVMNYQGGFEEIKRVLTKKGTLGILEFFRQENSTYGNKLFSIYLKNIMPFVGKIISGDPYAYKYLAESIARFVTLDEFIKHFKENEWTITWRHNFFLNAASGLLLEKKCGYH